ncbi:MAG TPA: glycosyltransferase family A protein [Candidatus Dormibacteraeota bacterium]
MSSAPTPRFFEKPPPNPTSNPRFFEKPGAEPTPIPRFLEKPGAEPTPNPRFLEKPPRFSVLLPTRNGGRFLRDCIASVLGQDDPDFELVVADNANTDDTPAVLAEFAGDPRLRVIRHPTVLSVTENWSSTLHASRGDYLVMIGDDDCLLPGYFATLRDTLARYQEPEAVVYNGFSYVFPGSIGDHGSYFSDPHFRFDRGLQPGPLSPEYRRQLVKGMFRFVVRYPLNIQLTLFSRRAMQRVPPPFFRQPFPDHFAINSLLLLAGSIVYHPERLAVIGLSPKSFGHYAYGGDSASGMTYLGSESDFPGRLEGSELINSMHRWLSLLKTAYPSELAGIEIDRGAYLRRQVASWLFDARAGHIPAGEAARRLLRLDARDKLRLAASPTSPDTWRRVPRLLALARREPIRQSWPRAAALGGVSGIAEFAEWASRERPTVSGLRA